MTIETKNPTVTFTVQVRENYRTHPHWGVWEALRDAILMSPASRYISQDGQRQILDNVAKTLGLDPWDEYETSDDPILVDSLTAARQAAQNLLDFIPESGYPDALAAEGFSHGNVGFFATEDEYREYLKDAKFFSDPVLYAVLRSGKHDGRTLKSRVRDLREALGLTDDDD